LSRGIGPDAYHACYERRVLRAFLIRHGKASSLLAAADYDALSPTGVSQAEHLGTWLATQGIAGDAVFMGPRKRHAETYAAAAKASATQGHTLGPPAVVGELDEHDAVNRIAELLPVLVAEDPAVGALVMAAAAGETPSEAELLTAFKGVARRWVAGELPGADIESWPAFRARVGRALDVVRSTATGEPRTALVFTSAGVIAAAVASVLELRDDKAVDLSVAPFNASITELELVHDGAEGTGPTGAAGATGRWVLRTFNATPHLREPGLLTRI
jgi:broad specificity phosphatase PhoE